MANGIFVNMHACAYGSARKKLTFFLCSHREFTSLELYCDRCPRGPVGIAALLCRGQTAGGGSISRWSASKRQVR